MLLRRNYEAHLTDGETEAQSQGVDNFSKVTQIVCENWDVSPVLTAFNFLPKFLLDIELLTGLANLS